MRRFVTAALGFGLAACSAVLGSDIGVVVALATSTATIPQQGTLTITVTATNESDEPLVWGQGSSSCQLGAVVRDGGEEHPIGDRVCTADYGPQGLGPGASRTEQWEWDGTYRSGAATVILPPGSYAIRGTAGDVHSPALTVTVTATGN